MNEIDKCLLQVVRYYQSYFGRIFASEEKHKVARKRGSYTFIPSYDIDYLLPIFKALFPFVRKEVPMDRPVRFLDVGCGVGNILLLAQSVGFQPHGLEIDPDLVAVAPKLLKCGKKNIIAEDMLVYDGYGEFDVIYYYVPLSDKTKMKQFVGRLIDQMRPGAYLLPYGWSEFNKDIFETPEIPVTMVRPYKKIG